MLKLPSRARYALRSMIAFAKLSKDNKPVSLAIIANKLHISKGYLEHIATQLKNASLLTSVSGKGGGYYFSRPPDQIMLGEVIEAVIGQINVVECVRRPESCLINDFCECRKVYVLINERILSALNSSTIADLAGIAGNDCAEMILEVKGSSDILESPKYVAGGSPCMTK